MKNSRLRGLRPAAAFISQAASAASASSTTPSGWAATTATRTIGCIQRYLVVDAELTFKSKSILIIFLD